VTVDRHHDDPPAETAPRTLLIASDNVLAACSTRATAGGLIACTDSDSASALDVLSRHRADVVVVEQAFLASQRGAAFLQQLQNEPAFSGVQVRVLSPERAASLIGGAQGPLAPGALVALAQPVPPRPIRKAMRIKVPSGIQVIVDGSEADLIDLSVCGAQVISATVLRPNQRIRLLLPADEGAVRLSAGIAWSSFELPPSRGPRYRAGMEFKEIDPRVLEQFCGKWRMK